MKHFWKDQPLQRIEWSLSRIQPIHYFYMDESIPIPGEIYMKQSPYWKDPFSIQFHTTTCTSKHTLLFTYSLYNSHTKLGSISFYPIYLYQFDYSNEKEAWIVDSLYVHPKYRKQGIAPFLIFHIIYQMQQCHIPYVFFYHDNIPIPMTNIKPIQTLSIYCRSILYPHQIHSNTHISFQKGNFLSSFPWKQNGLYTIPQFLSPSFEMILILFQQQPWICFYGTIHPSNGIFTLHHFYIHEHITTIDYFPYLCQWIWNEYPNIQWNYIIHCLPPIYKHMYEYPWIQDKKHKRKIYGYNIYMNEEQKEHSYFPSWTD
jgi:hypothetical protein